MWGLVLLCLLFVLCFCISCSLFVLYRSVSLPFVFISCSTIPSPDFEYIASGTLIFLGPVKIGHTFFLLTDHREGILGLNLSWHYSILLWGSFQYAYIWTKAIYSHLFNLSGMFLLVNSTVYSSSFFSLVHSQVGSFQWREVSEKHSCTRFLSPCVVKKYFLLFIFLLPVPRTQGTSMTLWHMKSPCLSWLERAQ